MTEKDSSNPQFEFRMTVDALVNCQPNFVEEDLQFAARRYADWARERGGEIELVAREILTKYGFCHLFEINS